jgi:hypothetical protein
VEWQNGELFPRVGFMVTNSSRPAKRVVRFYNQRGAGGAVDQGRQERPQMGPPSLSCLCRQPGAVATLRAGPQPGRLSAEGCAAASGASPTSTTLREKLVKIGAKVVRRSRKRVFQLAEVAVQGELFRAILEGIGRLKITRSSIRMTGKVKGLA